jgi:hypothetical protein
MGNSLVIAVLAAIVASQAMITSTFQLLTQVMRLSYFPHIKVVHTSERFHEQVYMPLANWLLMIGTVVVTAVYNNVSEPCQSVSQSVSQSPRSAPTPPSAGDGRAIRPGHLSRPMACCMLCFLFPITHQH